MMRLFDIRRRDKHYPTLPFPTLVHVDTVIEIWAEFNKAKERRHKQMSRQKPQRKKNAHQSTA